MLGGVKVCESYELGPVYVEPELDALVELVLIHVLFGAEVYP